LSSSVSNPDVDDLFELAMSAGALGGKLTGAGGGGFLLLFVPPEHQERVRSKLNKLIHVPIKFEFLGSQIIFFDREEDYLAEEKARAGQTIGAFRELEPSLV
jgi:D-glycero-alpha-D-manno-heptose-7-phosphate kinase